MFFMIREMSDTIEQNKTKDQYFGAIKDCKEIFLKKSIDYGTSWSILRMPSLTDQVYIKAERIRTLEENRENRVGESLESEYKGIINYCIIALIKLEIRDDHQGHFPNEFDHIDTLEEKYNEKVKFAYDTMQDKNHDYGEAWRNMRISSFTDLILMKILRLKQIENNAGETLISEGEDANYIDILNYAVFALVKMAEVDE